MKIILNSSIPLPIAILSCISLLLGSCSVNQFSSPQPVDAENLYSIPKNLRGTYLADDDTLTLGADFIKISSSGTMKVINGLWTSPLEAVRADSTGNTKLSHQDSVIMRSNFKSLRTRRYNEETKSWDTVSNYLVSGNRIFKINSDGKLNRGLPFRIRQDTIHYTEAGSLLQLGPGAFLRKISANSYAINVNRGGYFDEGKENGWWILIVIQRTKDGRIWVRDLDSKIERTTTPIYIADGDKFFDVKWTKQDLIKLIEHSDSTELKPFSARNRNPQQGNP